MVTIEQGGIRVEGETMKAAQKALRKEIAKRQKAEEADRALTDLARTRGLATLAGMLDTAVAILDDNSARNFRAHYAEEADGRPDRWYADVFRGRVPVCTNTDEIALHVSTEDGEGDRAYMGNGGRPELLAVMIQANGYLRAVKVSDSYGARWCAVGVAEGHVALVAAAFRLNTIIEEAVAKREEAHKPTGPMGDTQ